MTDSAHLYGKGSGPLRTRHINRNTSAAYLESSAGENESLLNEGAMQMKMTDQVGWKGFGNEAAWNTTGIGEELNRAAWTGPGPAWNVTETGLEVNRLGWTTPENESVWNAAGPGSRVDYQDWNDADWTSDETVQRLDAAIWTGRGSSVLWNSTMNMNGWLDGNGSRGGNESEYEYDYDYEAALGTFFWGELLPPLLVYSLTYLLGVTGNSLIIFTICRFRRLRTTTNVFLASLASADLLLLLICIPVKIARLFSYSWTLGYTLCKAIYYLQAVSSVCSVLTLTVMSLERCYAIMYPMRAIYVCSVSKARRAVSVIWLFSLVLASPALVVQVHMEVGMRVTAYWCVRDLDQQELWQGYETFMLVLVLLVPATVMAAAYTAICGAVITTVAQRRTITGKGQMVGVTRPQVGVAPPPPDLHQDKTIRQVVPMLVVVVVLFIVCWAPILILNVLISYTVVPLVDQRTKHIRTALDLLSYFNSCMNPVVYGFMSKNFRKGFKRALCHLVGRPEELAHRSLSQSHTLRTFQHRQLHHNNGSRSATRTATLYRGEEYSRRSHSNNGQLGSNNFEKTGEELVSSCHM